MVLRRRNEVETLKGTQILGTNDIALTRPTRMPHQTDVGDLAVACGIFGTVWPATCAVEPAAPFDLSGSGQRGLASATQS